MIFFFLCSCLPGWRALSAPSSPRQGESGEAAVQGRRRRQLRPHGRQRLVQPGGPPRIRRGADRDLPARRESRPRAPVRLGEQGLRQPRHAVHGTAQDQSWRHRPESGAEPECCEADRHLRSVILSSKVSKTPSPWHSSMASFIPHNSCS